MTASSQSSYKTTGGSPPSVPASVAMHVDAAGLAQPNAVAGSDKVVYQGVTPAGAVIFASPPVAGLTTTQIAALTTTQISALASSVILTDIAVATLTTTAINALTPGNYYDAPIALTTTQLNSLTTSTIAALTTTQVAALTTTSIIGQIPAAYGALIKPELPISTMLAVVPVAAQTVAVAVRSK